MSRKNLRQPIPELLTPADLPPIGLPRPRLRGSMQLDACLQMRRSTRHFSPSVISMAEVTQLLWAAQGVTGLGGLRTAPSAGALYAIRTYLLAVRVRGLPIGLYKYDADEHYIRMVKHGDTRPELINAGLDRSAESAAIVIVLAADFRRPAREYGPNAQRLIHIEAGHIGQNICLEGTSLGLGTIGLGALDTQQAREVLGLSVNEEPIYFLAVGKKIGSDAIV